MQFIKYACSQFQMFFFEFRIDNFFAVQRLNWCKWLHVMLEEELRSAAARGNVELVKELLKQGAIFSPDSVSLFYVT